MFRFRRACIMSDCAVSKNGDMRYPKLEIYAADLSTSPVLVEAGYSLKFAADQSREPARLDILKKLRARGLERSTSRQLIRAGEPLRVPLS
jgi:hypothetical protein